MVQDTEIAALMRRAAFASLTAALILVATKAYVWVLSGSVAMQGSLADSSLDVLASLITVLAVRTALKPADDSHRFGHGKAEALAALFQSQLMLVAAVVVIAQALRALWMPQPTMQPQLMINVSVFAVFVTLVLVLYQRRVIARTGSLAVAGDHLHYKGDLLLNLGVIAAAIGNHTGLVWMDGGIGLLIGFYIAYGALHVLRPAIDMLMDREFSDDMRARIVEIAAGVAGVVNVHDLRTRGSGPHKIIQFHIAVDAGLSVQDGHAVLDRVKSALEAQFDRTDILIHVDPADPSDQVQT